jgi:O-antigen/teichoic acid export membrane protein
MKTPQISTFGKVLIKYATSQVLSNFLRIIAGFLVVLLLDPENYGVYTGVGVYLGYFALGHFGIINGLGREFPYQLGKGNIEYGKQLANSAFAVTILIGLLAAVVFLGLSVYYFVSKDNLLGVTFLSYVIVAGLNLFNTQFFPTLYRTSSDFNKLSKINIVFGCWNLISVLLVWQFRFSGLLIRGIVLVVIQSYLLYKNKPYKLYVKPIKHDLIHLFKTGFPIYMVGQVNPLWSTVVNNIIFTMGGARFYGLYALANIVQTTAQMVPTSFSQVIYPRMSIMFGEGKTPPVIIRLNLKSMFFQVLVTIAIAIGGVFLLPVIIPWLLPKYVDGIAPAQLVLFIPVVDSFGAINNIFNVTGQQKFYFISLITGAIFGTGFIYLSLLHSGFSLLLFPQGMILGILVQQIMSLFFVFRLK